MDSSSLNIGDRMLLPWQAIAGEMLTDDLELTRFLTHDWFRHCIERQIGTPFPIPESPASQAGIPTAVLRHPTLVVGATGSGKSRVAEHLICEQIRQGQSALVLDPKGETVADLLALAKACSLPPERVTVLSMRHPRIPGWNPLGTALPIGEAVGDVVSVLEKDSRDSWGRRLSNILTCALLILAAHRLSLHELPRFLSRDDYRSQLLRLPPVIPLGRAFQEARQFFLEEYNQWSPSSRNEASAPVLNKIRGILRHDYLAPLLCARTNTLDLAQLWQEQRLVLVHLDEAALGDEGVRLLAGMLICQLFRTAQRMAETPSRIQNAVVLALDELASLEHLVGEEIVSICTKARSMELRLLVACQHLTQLSEKLRNTLLSNTDLRLMFRLGSHSDAKAVAAQLAEGTEDTVRRCTLERESGKGGRLTVWRQELYDEHGHRLRGMGGDRGAFTWAGLWSKPVAQGLYEAAGRGKVQRLYVRPPQSGRCVELCSYLQGLRPTDCWADITPEGVWLILGYPRLKVTNVHRISASDIAAQWAKTLMDLPKQHCVVKRTGSAPYVVRVADIHPPPRLPPTDPYVQAVSPEGQAAEETAALFAWRDALIDGVVRGERAKVTTSKETASPVPTLSQPASGQPPSPSPLEESDDESIF